MNFQSVLVFATCLFTAYVTVIAAYAIQENFRLKRWLREERSDREKTFDEYIDDWEDLGIFR